MKLLKMNKKFLKNANEFSTVINILKIFLLKQLKISEIKMIRKKCNKML